MIKREISTLTDSELNEVTAFVFHLRHRHDPEYQRTVDARVNDPDKSQWLTPDEFERRLDACEAAIAAGTAKFIDWEDAKRQIIEEVR